MRHGVSGKKFGRNQTLRAATIRDLVKAVLINQKIQTTRIKAGEARKAVDKMITLGKKNTLAAKRRAFAILCDHALVSNLFTTIAPRFANRQGGYTRVIKLSVNRQGDNAEMAILELTEKSIEPKKTETNVRGTDAKAAKSDDKKVEDAVVVAEKPAKKVSKKATAEGDVKTKTEKTKKTAKKA
jgi:large subunit ribosomal protein L17